jgi:hypothetical protein
MTNRRFRSKSIAEQFERARGTRSLGARFLIVCEDTKSCHRYFEALKRFYKISASAVICLPSEAGPQPRKVVGYAKSVMDSARADELPFDQVWCIFDGDYGSEINNARHQSRAHGIQLAISTQCFEHWLLLHFEENDQACINCDCVCSKLRAKWPTYEKGNADFDPIMDKVSDACIRAQRQRERLRNVYPNPEEQNPCSEVYLLVSNLLNA